VTKEGGDHLQDGGILLPEQANRFIKKLLQEGVIFPPRTAWVIPWYKRPWAILRNRWRYSRVRLAWGVLRGRNPSELHEDCW
jgi:hypothetical protein